jgi:hypothetical protein
MSLSKKQLNESVKIGKNTEGGNNTSSNTVLTHTRRQKPAHKSPTAAGMREHNRSRKLKKEIPNKI